MRTKLFIAFLTVILMALVSNIIFKEMIIGDFEEYALSQREDKLYWVLAAVEGAHGPAIGRWNMTALTYALQLGTILGFDIHVHDTEGQVILTSEDAIMFVTPTMRRRIESLVFLDSPEGEYDDYPLFSGGEEIGSMSVRTLVTRGIVKEKEQVFKSRGRTFMLMSFLIAGGGAVVLAVLLSLYLTRPLRRLKKAAQEVASGNLGVRLENAGARDEVGSLMRSFNYMVESLEREESIRRHLTSNVAHELRTPLAILKSNIEAISDGVVPASRETLDSLQAEVERLVTLIKGIEDLTRAEAGFLKPAELVRIDAGEFLANVVNSLSPLALEKGISLALEGPPSGLVVLTDAGKLEIAVRNIVTNALKHTRQGRVGVACRGEGDALVIDVADTGPGIDPAERERIFERFYKGRGSSGIGLGLAIARELLEVIGGTVEALEAPSGGGSVFRITLPISGPGIDNAG